MFKINIRKYFYNNQENFVKENKIEDVDFSKGEYGIVNNIEGCKKRLGELYNNLKYSEGKMIDYYIFQIKAEEAKFDYLIKLLK